MDTKYVENMRETKCVSYHMPNDQPRSAPYDNVAMFNIFLNIWNPN